VPIHPRLIELGLPKYVADICKSDKARVFEDIYSVSKAAAKNYFSQWFGRYKEYIALSDDGLVFHSFRHTMITQLRDMSAPDYLIWSIVGHGESKKTQTDQYGGAVSPATKLEWLKKIDPVWLAKL
jgi:integrase